MRWSVVLFFAAACGCGTTGGDAITYNVAAVGTGTQTVDTGLGWHVVLTEATLHVGALYLDLAVPISGAQATNCILPGIYTGEELAGRDIDALSTMVQPFPDLASGTDDTARTGEVWLTGGDVNAATDTTVVARVAGIAIRDFTDVKFSAEVTISQSNRGIPSSDPAQPSQHPICKQRIVSPIPIDLTPHAGGTLLLTVDAAGWFANVDFTAVPADGVIPDDNSNAASQSLFTGIRAATTTFQLAFP